MRYDGGPVRLIPGYGGKYLMREDGTLWRQKASGEFVSVSVYAGRVRLYYLGTESRPQISTLYRLVFPERHGWTTEEVLEHDGGVGDIRAGGTPSIPSMALEDRRDGVGDALGEILAEESGDSGETSGKTSGGFVGLPDEFFDL
jgi:hypothetical protein